MRIRRIAVIMFATGCGGGVAGTPAAGRGDASAPGSNDAASSEEDAWDGGDEASADEASADGSCDDLSAKAHATFQGFVDANQACMTDSDCTTLASPGRCLVGCGYVLNSAALPAAMAAATQLCMDFDARSCPLPAMGCPPPLTPTCQAGTCAFKR